MESQELMYRLVFSVEDLRRLVYDMETRVIIFIPVFLLTLLFFVFWISRGKMRDPKSLVVEKPEELLSFTTDREYEDVLRLIVEYGLRNLELHYWDRHEGVIILGESMVVPRSRVENGFLYPIYITSENGRTFVEIGAKQAAFANRRLISVVRQRMFNVIRAVVEFQPETPAP